MNSTFLRKIFPLILIISSFSYGFIEGPSLTAVALCFISVLITIILNPKGYDPNELNEHKIFNGVDPLLDYTYRHLPGNIHYTRDDWSRFSTIDITTNFTNRHLPGNIYYKIDG